MAERVYAAKGESVPGKVKEHWDQSQVFRYATYALPASIFFPGLLAPTIITMGGTVVWHTERNPLNRKK